jgi:alpha-mannosidase
LVDDNPNGRVRLDAAALAMLRVRRFSKFRIRPAVYQDVRPVEISAWAVGGEPVSFADALSQQYRPFAIGQPWGRPWDTVWFDVRGEVPADWPTEETELVVDLGFTGDQPGFQAEALVYRPDGEIVKAVEPYNGWIPLSGPGPFHLLIEAAANPIVQVPYEYEPTAMGDKRTAGDELQYRLRDLSVRRRDRTVWELLQDISTLDGLVDVLPEYSSRRAEIVDALERMVDRMDPDDVAGTAAVGREILGPVLDAPAARSSLIVGAVGHAHIDCAWLWPTRETVRKVSRTFANVLDLTRRHPEFIFAASSAQQFAWVRDHQPQLFERVRKAVADGAIRPVGGMWVESDTNMPSGESLVRQFVLGKQFFAAEFGVETEEVWLPDSFGYTAALPQIARAAGARYFLTQKPSWNETNAMPHSSFLWEGIDGSRLFTHFPPAETYNSDLGAADLARTEKTFRQKGRAQQVMGLYGWGDGGGGPTREMLAAADRKRDLDGSPRVRLTDPGSFFEAAERELEAPPVWVGEMYLELHRGTLTSQQRGKRGNRHSEALLREAELWAATAAIRLGTPYPYETLQRVWERVLLLQFHDILPGTSIAWVHQDADREYAAIAETLTGLIDEALDLLAGSGDTLVHANAGPYARHGVGAMSIAEAQQPAAAVPHREADGIVLADDQLRVVVDEHGTISSVVDVAAQRELVPAGLSAGVLQLFRDTPREWDAWDINDEDKRSVRELVDPAGVEICDDAVLIRHELGATTIAVRVQLVQGKIDFAFEIDWHESEKLLKLAFPLDVRADHATSEIQFGHLHRPVHQNTSWDVARFETVAHRWIQIGEPGYGVAIANDVVYGHDIRNGRGPDGHPTTTARLSLLRAPRYPDPAADQGRHRFTVSLRPGGIPEAVADGYAQQLPMRSVRGTAVDGLLDVDDPAVAVESVKLAEDRSGDLVVRLYEAHGNRSRATIGTRFHWSAVRQTDLLERAIEASAVRRATADAEVGVELRPFELLTLRFSRPTD